MTGLEQLTEADLFANGPIIDDSILSFDVALGRAAKDVTDLEAFSAIKYRFKQARESGELAQLYSMAMMVGAMACMHDHLQAFSNDLTGQLGGELSVDTHEHIGHQHDDDDDDDPKSKKKKRPRWFR